MTELDKQIDNSVLAELLGADGIDSLRAKLIDMIVDEVREQLQGSSEYIISPDDIARSLYDDIYEEVKEEVKEELKESVAKQLISRFDITM